MQSEAITPDAFLSSLEPADHQVMQDLRRVIRDNLPQGFAEVMQYGMLSYVVPHNLYPAGYHAKPADPLPFVSLARQKQHFAVYHMGLYASPSLTDWFRQAYETQYGRKLDMGKSCLRFRKPEHIPFRLLAELMRKITVDDYIEAYRQVDPRTAKA